VSEPAVPRAAPKAVRKGSRILSRRDLDFLLYEWLDVTSLTTRERYREHSKEVFDSVLDLYEQLAADAFAPHNRDSDENEPRFDGRAVHLVPAIGHALSLLAESGLNGSTLDAAYGGGQLPHAVHRAGFAWLQAANTATAAYAMLTAANASLLSTYGTAEQIDRFVRPMVEGRFFGTMCLSEPQAGSSLSDVATRALKTSDGTYRLFGNKMWISGGEHDLSENIVHLVLARIEGAPAGVKGLSLFIVPKYLVAADGSLSDRNDVVLAGLNHKMGNRGTTNTVLNFGEGAFEPEGASGAVGYLVGEQNRGLECMFHMMNEARIAVGANAVALGYTGYLHALDYARTRAQGRPFGDKDPTAPQVPIVNHPDVRRMLLASKSYVEGGLALVLYAARLLDESLTAEDESERERAALLLEVLTPIVKAWPSTWCLKANDLAIQVHGGYGYTREYPVEQFYRDNRLNPIHEGTDGIQAIDLLGRKVRMRDGAGLSVLVESILGAVERAPAELKAEGDLVRVAIERIVVVTDTLWASGDPGLALANATLYAEALGHVVVAWMWLEQLIAAAGRAGEFYDGKRAAARYFFTYELPRIGPHLDLLATADSLLLDLDEALL
jgi:alkylation response protein AidB-like acyl-CoA dehydrogenase